MNELKNFKERKLKNFREKFPVFLTRNYTADTLVGKFDEDGNLLPSEESERLRVFSEVEQFISDLIDEMEKAIPAKSDETNLIGSVGHNHCIEEFLTNLNS